MTSEGCGPVGAGHTNGAQQIRSTALGMTNKERVVARKRRLLVERVGFIAALVVGRLLCVVNDENIDRGLCGY